MSFDKIIRKDGKVLNSSRNIFLEDELNIDMYDGTINVSVGDIVYTSGVSEIYPANLPVAKVIKVKKERDKPFQDVIVEILADFKNLNYVFVIK